MCNVSMMHLVCCATQQRLYSRLYYPALQYPLTPHPSLLPTRYSPGAPGRLPRRSWSCLFLWLSSNAMHIDSSKVHTCNNQYHFVYDGPDLHAGIVAICCARNMEFGGSEFACLQPSITKDVRKLVLSRLRSSVCRSHGGYTRSTLYWPASQ